MKAPRRDAGFALPAFSLRKPVTVMVGLAALLVLGAMAYLRIPVQLLPEGLTMPFLLVHINYWNATPREVEEQIAKPVEEVLGTVHNVKKMVSKSAPNYARFFLEFEDGTDMDLTYNQVRDRIDRVQASLPADVGQIFFWKWNPASEPILFLGIGFPPGQEDPRWLVEQHLKRPIERLKGVSMIEIWGAAERMALIEIDADRARAHRIDPFWLVSRLSRDNFAQTAGSVVEGGTKLLVRSLARFSDLQMIRDLPLTRDVRLGDVAEVRLGYPPEEWISRLNGGPGLAMGIYKESGANTVEIAQDVREAVERQLAENPDLRGCEARFFFDQGEQITQSVGNLQETALWGAFFAVIVLFGFLRRARMTLVITLAIPLSLLVSLVVLYFAGDSMNILSMIGLMLSVGMVVDNSIVVVENIYRRRQGGDDPGRAALDGAGEVALAVLLATLTTMVVFLPLMFLTGSETLSFYLKAIGLPVCYALLASLAMALVAIPLATRRLGGGAARPSRFLHWLGETYTRGLAVVLRRRVDSAIVAVLVLASILIPYYRTGSTDRMEGNINDVQLRVAMPTNMSFEDRDKVLQTFETWLDGLRDELGIVDLHVLLMPHRPRARIRIFFAPPDERPVERREAIKRLREEMPVIPGVDTRIGWHRQEGEEGSIKLRILGRDSERLKELAEEVVRRLKPLPSLTSVELNVDEDAADEIRVQPWRELAHQRGLSPSLVGGSVAYALRGSLLRDLRTPNRDVTMRVMFKSSDMESVDDLADLPLKGAADWLAAAQVAAQALTGQGSFGASGQGGASSGSTSSAVGGAAAAEASGLGGIFGATSGSAFADFTAVWAAQWGDWTRQFGDPTKYGARPAVPSLAMDVPLNTLSQFQVAKGFSEIRRENRKASVEIAAYSTEQDLSALGAAIDRTMEGFAFPRGYRLDKGSRFAAMGELFNEILFAVLLGLVFVYVIMSGLFESLVLPLSVLISVPFALLGVYWMLYLSDTIFDVMSGVGLVILIGIVVNNAIVLVDLIQRLRGEGLGRFEAVIEAGRHRMRPILMTALTTIFGLIPMAIGKAQVIGVPYAPLGRAVIGGLVASTLFTLFVVPLAYTYFDDLGNLYHRLRRHYRREQPAAPG